MESAGHTRRNDALMNPANLLDGLLRVSQIVRLRFNDWLGDFDLNDGRYSVLSALSQADAAGCSQADLAEQLGQSESNISTLVERMSRDGLVNRIRSDADRRKRVLSITPIGRSTLASVDANRFAWAGRLMIGISEDERSTLLSLLQKLGACVEKRVLMPNAAPATIPISTEVAPLAATDSHANPSEDPQSPQFALRLMLLALSSSADVETQSEKDVA